MLAVGCRRDGAFLDDPHEQLQGSGVEPGHARRGNRSAQYNFGIFAVRDGTMAIDCCCGGSRLRRIPYRNETKTEEISIWIQQ